MTASKKSQDGTVPSTIVYDPPLNEARQKADAYLWVEFLCIRHTLRFNCEVGEVRSYGYTEQILQCPDRKTVETNEYACEAGKCFIEL